MAELSIQWVLMIMIGICGIQDMLKKKRYLWLVIFGALFIIVCIPFCQSYGLLDRLAGFSIGAVIIVVSIATSGKIGLGDGILLCLTGVGLGFWSNLELFAIALTFAAIISIGLLTFRLADRKKAIPFVPFLFIAYLFVFFSK